MKVKIDDLVFDRANYDGDGDVLYLTRGGSNMAADAALTPEGHGVRYNADGQVIGVTISTPDGCWSATGISRSRCHTPFASRPESWPRHSARTAERVLLE